MWSLIACDIFAEPPKSGKRRIRIPEIPEGLLQAMRILGLLGQEAQDVFTQKISLKVYRVPWLECPQGGPVQGLWDQGNGESEVLHQFSNGQTDALNAYGALRDQERPKARGGSKCEQSEVPLLFTPDEAAETIHMAAQEVTTEPVSHS